MLFLDRIPNNTLVKTICYPTKPPKIDRDVLFLIPTATPEEFFTITDIFLNNKTNCRLKLPKCTYIPYKESIYNNATKRILNNKNYQNDIRERKDRGYLKVSYIPSVLADYNGFIDVSRIIEATINTKFTVANTTRFWENLILDRGFIQKNKFLVFTKDNMKVKLASISSVTTSLGMNSKNLYINFMYNMKYHYDKMKKLLVDNKFDIIFTDYSWSLRINHKELPAEPKEFFTELFTNLRRMNTGVFIDDEGNSDEDVFIDEPVVIEDDNENEKLLKAVEKLQDLEIVNEEEATKLNKEITDDAVDKTPGRRDKGLEYAIKVNEIINKSKEDSLPKYSEKMKKLRKRNESIKEKQLDEVMAELEKNEMELITPKKVASNTESFSEFKIENMDKEYEKTAKKTRMDVGDNMSNAATPLFMSGYKEKEDNSADTKSKVVSYTFTDPNSNNTHSFTVRVPELRDGKFLHINGSDKVLIRQKMALPIIKIKDNVLFTSYYGKMFFDVSRGNISKSVAKVKRYIRYIRKNHTSSELNDNFDFTPAFFFCDKSNYLSNELLEISRYFTNIQIGANYITFNNCRNTVSDKNTRGLIAEIDNRKYFATVNHEIEDEDGKVLDIVDLFTALFHDHYSNEMFGIWETIYKKKENTVSAYSTCMLMKVQTPILMILLHAMNENLYDLLEVLKSEYKLEYSITPFDTKKPAKLYNEYEGDRFLFSNFVLDVKYNNLSNRILLEYLNNLDLTQYDSLKLEGIIDATYPSRHVMNMENYKDFFIDNVATAQILEDLGIPTDYAGAILYCNNLLIQYDRSISEISLVNERMPSNAEIIHGVLYKEMANAMVDYSNKVKRGSKSAQFSVERDAVIKTLLTLPNMEESSKLNPIQHVDKTYTISNKGISGVNEERAYTLPKRKWDDSFFGVMSDVSPFTKASGISRHLAINPNIVDNKGYFKSKTADEVKDSEIMSISEAMAPFSQKHDSAPRLAMLMSQMNHTVSVHGAEPALVTYGMDETISQIETDFNHKMEDDGTIIDFNDRYIKVVYDNIKDESGNPKMVVFAIDKIERNAAKAKYILNSMQINPKINLKKGAKLKRNTVIAYNKEFYTASDNDIIYKPGPIAWVAITNHQSSYEDATVMNTSLAKKLGTTNLKRIAVKLNPRYKIAEYAKMGPIKSGDTIIKYSEDTGSDYYNKNLDMELLDDFLMKNKKSNYRGNVRDVYIYYKLTQDEYDNIDPSIKSFMNYVEKYYNSRYNNNTIAYGIENYEKNRNTDHITKFSGSKKSKVNGDSVDNGEILIEFFIETETPFSIGDKLIFSASALKGVCSKIIPDEDSPYGATTKRRVDAILSTYSPSKRMVTSFFMNGLLNACMLEINKHIKENILKL